MRTDTIPHLAETAALKWPDSPALIENGQQWNFAELWSEARAAIAACLAQGIGEGDRVAIWAPNSRLWALAAIGAMGAGAAVVPLNTRYKGREAGDILRRTKARILFTVDDFLGTDYPALLAGEDLPDLERTLLLTDVAAGADNWSAFIAEGTARADDVDAALASLTADHLSDILFTSGTTGSPKGVMMSYARVLPQVKVWIGNTGLHEGERYLIVNPFFHSFGMKVGWVACLMAGAVMVPMPQFDVAEAAQCIEREKINFLPGAPTIFQMLIAHKRQHPFDSSSLRGGTTGAATVPPVLIEEIRSELGMADIITAYGMTECVNITGCRPGDPVELIAHSCGAAIPGNDVIIADDAGCEVPRGETGEILVRGQGVMLGYLDDPAATAEAIDPQGWLHTGDIGTMDAQGYVRITDRKKDLYISGGFNVYPAEVEKLLAAHPAIAMVAVIGVADERLGEIGRAYVVLRSGMSASEAELVEWSRANMANFKVPRSFVFVEDLPRNASGKVLKTELRGAAAA
ncbi:AMP-binding protein [Sphingorhabdus sp.]|jgi:acyl-CoA synthetase (AMP-forming)/AMP-acid ligase II|uniref:AMP-binding protein n=1 Tax=Sphingorhabdus sp. TaxID=1902408 RepID=UPI0037C6CBED